MPAPRNISARILACSLPSVDSSAHCGIILIGRFTRFGWVSLDIQNVVSNLKRQT